MTNRQTFTLVGVVATLIYSAIFYTLFSLSKYIPSELLVAVFIAIEFSLIFFFFFKLATDVGFKQK